MVDVYQIEPIIFWGLIVAVGALIVFLSLRIRTMEQEQYNLQKATRESEAQFRHLFNYAHDAILLIDLELQTIADANLRAHILFHYEPKEFVGLPVSAISTEDQGGFQIFSGGALREGPGELHELGLLTKDGELLACEVSASLLNRGETSYLIAQIRNVTDRNRAAAEHLHQATELRMANEDLASKERLLRVFHEIGKVVVSSLDLSTVLDSFSREVVVAGIFRSLMVALVDAEARSVEVVRALGPKPGGDEGEVAPFEKPLGWRYGLDDPNVTAEVARTGEVVVIAEPDDVRLDRRMAVSSEEWGDKVSYFIPVMKGNETVAVLATGSRAAERREMLDQIEAMKPLLDQFAFALEHCRLYRRLQTSLDALQRSEGRFRTLVDQATDAFYLHDLDGRLIDVNRYACECLGYTREELLQMSVLDIDADIEVDDLGLLWEKMTYGVAVAAEGIHRRKDGTTFPVEVRVGKFYSGDEPMVLALARDISERTKL